MKGFLLKIAFFVLPFALVAGAYLASDPFKVLYHYEAFGSHNPVSINVDWLSTETYLRHREERKWDAFLFGSSRTLAFRSEDWTPYLEGARTFRFNANRESLFGVHRKIRLIDELGDPIRHALLLVDADLLARTRDSSGHLYVKHPRLSGRSRIDFQMIFFQAWFQDFFFGRYLDWRLFGTFRPWMARTINLNRMEIDPLHNDVFLRDQDERLAADEDGYYAQRKGEFARARATAREDAPVIGAAQQALLEEIAAIFRRHGTRAEIVVSPNYAWPPLHPADRAVLEDLFGAGHVHDYSGKNDITRDERNYYERIHFRPHVGRRILREIYGGAPAGADGRADGAARSGASPPPGPVVR